MKRTLIAALLLTPLMLLLNSCQRESSTQQADSSAAVSAPATSPAVEQPVPQAMVAAKPDAKNEAAKSGGALSDTEGRALAQKNNCFSCHMIEKKLVGPAWKDIAAKYRGQKDAEAKLAAKVAKGGSGVWGSVPMPPNAPKVSENDIKALVQFILALK